MKRTVEIFTAGCPVCDPVVKLVNETSCDTCKVIIYDLVKQCKEKTCTDKMVSYGINQVPSVVVNGQLLRAITKQDLVSVGFGQA